MSLFDENLLGLANAVPAVPAAAFTGLGDDACARLRTLVRPQAVRQSLIRRQSCSSFRQDESS